MLVRRPSHAALTWGPIACAQSRDPLKAAAGMPMMWPYCMTTSVGMPAQDLGQACSSALPSVSSLNLTSGHIFQTTHAVYATGLSRPLDRTGTACN